MSTQMWNAVDGYVTAKQEPEQSDFRKALDATALQSVGSKGYDGLVICLVKS